jgi:hypothetical protein
MRLGKQRGPQRRVMVMLPREKFGGNAAGLLKHSRFELLDFHFSASLAVPATD